MSTEFVNAVAAFSEATDKSKKASPFSLRLTPQERAFLDQQAGGQPLGPFIRARLLGEAERKRQKRRKPTIDHQQLAQLLAALGQSRLASNLNQLAKAANSGTLGVSDEVERELTSACQAIAAMRDQLILALGLKADSGI